MAASAVATGAASCVSSVSKLKEAARCTGSLGLKSQDADCVVLGMGSPFAVPRHGRASLAANRLKPVLLWRESLAIGRPGIVALPAEAREALAKLVGDGRRQPGVHVFEAALPGVAFGGGV